MKGDQHVDERSRSAVTVLDGLEIADCSIGTGDVEFVDCQGRHYSNLFRMVDRRVS
jgi:hypothetical protein